MPGWNRSQHQFMLALKGFIRRRTTTHRRIGRAHADSTQQRRGTGEPAWRAHGYVRRNRDTEDRREVLLSLTAKGEKVLRELSIYHTAELCMRGPILVSR